MNAITTATKNNSPSNNIKVIKPYQPTRELENKLHQYQVDTMNYYRFNLPLLKELQLSLKEIIDLTIIQIGNKLYQLQPTVTTIHLNSGQQ